MIKFVLLLGLATQAFALLADGPGQRMGPGRNDFGEAGLMQTPTARMAESGEISLQLSRVSPYERYTASLQVASWLDLSFGYTRVGNRRFGAEALSGDQSRKDKLAHFKAQLLSENRYRPALALGVRDAGGTGLFASEYLVASKRWNNLDFHLGLGWGQLANRGISNNPLSVFGGKFKSRDGGTKRGGNFETDDWFRGKRVGMFGGVELDLADRRWRLLLEYDSNDYGNEALGNNQRQRSPVNAGMRYRYRKGLDLQLGIERGDTAQLGITFRGNLNRMSGPEKSAIAKAERKRQGGDWQQLGDELDARQLGVQEIRVSGNSAVFATNQQRYQDASEAAERIARVADNYLPESYQRIGIESRSQGLASQQFVIDREQFRQFRAQRRAEVLLHAYLPGGGSSRYSKPVDTWETVLEPYLLQSIGGPDDFYLFQMNLAGRVHYRPDTRSEWTLIASAPLFGNFDNFEFNAPSGLPRVRTDINRYINDTDLGIARLQYNRFFQPSPQLYGQFYAGYLETMFGGVGAELLYRPAFTDTAIGVDINRVKQRDFNGGTGFRDYEVTTGQLSFYFKPLANLSARVSAGRYLAGDDGGGIELTRRFASGIEVSAFANFTDATSEDFGEGRFTKGFSFAIPMDLLFTTPKAGYLFLPFTPLVRDGGQALGRQYTLYSLTGGRSDLPSRISAPGPF